MPTRNVVLSDHQSRFVNRMVGSGRYQNASEVLREGLRLVERREAEAAARLEAVRNTVGVGIAEFDAGNARTFDVEATGLVAAWRLVSWENTSPEGVSHPMGSDPIGYLSYDRGGRMSVQVMRRERGELAADAVAAASEDRLRAVLGGYLAYGGRYEVNPAARTVTHRIEYAVMPAQVGTELTRWFEIDGTRLTLHLSPPTTDRPGTGGRVVWERIG